MKRHLIVRHDVFELARPFRIARGTRTQADVVTVTIAEGTAVGRGECTPYARYGESIASTIDAIEHCRLMIETGANRVAVSLALPPGAARNAIDCALWDLEAKLGRTSVAAMLGLSESLTQKLT